MSKRLFVLLLIACMPLVACEDDEESGGNGSSSGSVVESPKSRNASPSAAPADVTALAEGNTEFAMRLHREIVDPGENAFYSPFSISQALTMLYAGAETHTEREMELALDYKLNENILHPTFNYVDLELNSRGQGASGADGQPFRLNVVNAVWGQKGYTFLMPFLDTLKVHYGAGLRILDFAADPELARGTINDWVAKRTEDRITNLLPQGSIRSMTRLVLTNAIYFNAAWQQPFDEANTQKAPFYHLDGTTSQVDMMNGMLAGNYYEEPGVQVLEIPYDGQELSVFVLLPDAGNFDAFEQGLTGPELRRLISRTQTAQFQLGLPKFEFTSEFALNEPLADLGMPSAFDNADFSGIDGTRRLAVSAVVHKAFIAVNEQGTEAAAATGVVVGETSVPQFVQETIDRPFLFVIRDHGTETILFVGRVLAP